MKRDMVFITGMKNKYVRNEERNVFIRGMKTKDDNNEEENGLHKGDKEQTYY